MKTYRIEQFDNEGKVLVILRANSAEDAMDKAGLMLEYDLLEVDNRPGGPSIISVQRANQ